MKSFVPYTSAEGCTKCGDKSDCDFALRSFVTSGSVRVTHTAPEVLPRTLVSVGSANATESISAFVAKRSVERPQKRHFGLSICREMLPLPALHSQQVRDRDEQDDWCRAKATIPPLCQTPMQWEHPYLRQAKHGQGTNADVARHAVTSMEGKYPRLSALRTTQPWISPRCLTHWMSGVHHHRARTTDESYRSVRKSDHLTRSQCGRLGHSSIEGSSEHGVLEQMTDPWDSIGRLAPYGVVLPGASMRIWSTNEVEFNSVIAKRADRIAHWHRRLRDSLKHWPGPKRARIITDPFGMLGQRISRIDVPVCLNTQGNLTQPYDGCAGIARRDVSSGLDENACVWQHGVSLLNHGQYSTHCLAKRPRLQLSTVHDQRRESESAEMTRPYQGSDVCDEHGRTNRVERSWTAINGCRKDGNASTAGGVPRRAKLRYLSCMIDVTSVREVIDERLNPGPIRFGLSREPAPHCGDVNATHHRERGAA